jgi:hypothetical protein
VRDHEGEVIERKAGGAAQGADDGPLLLTGLPGRFVRPGGAVQKPGGRPGLVWQADPGVVCRGLGTPVRDIMREAGSVSSVIASRTTKRRASGVLPFIAGVASTATPDSPASPRPFVPRPRTRQSMSKHAPLLQSFTG